MRYALAFVNRAEAEKRMLAKFADRDLLGGIRATMTHDRADKLDAAASRAAFLMVFTNLIVLVPGDQWVLTDEVVESLGLYEIIKMS